MNTAEIVRINIKNHHLYCDMVYKRVKGRERNLEEKIDTKINHSKRIEKELNNKNFYVYAAKHNNKFIGWIHILYVPKIGKWNKGVLQIDELYVEKNYRNMGLGTELVKTALKLRDDLELEKIRLYTDNPIAQRVYEKAGFKIINQCVFMEN